MALMAQSASNQLRGTKERWYKNKKLRNKSYDMTVAMRADNAVQQAEECCKLSLQQVKYNMWKYICRKLCKIKADACMKIGLQ